MPLRYSAEKGAPVVGADKSITLCRTFKIVPELVAWDAVVGNRRCRPSWFAMMTFVAVENDGLRIPGPSWMPSATSSSMWPESSCCLFSPLDGDTFGGDGTSKGSRFDPSTIEIGPESDCEPAGCPALEAGAVGVFLRDLNENFFGGLNVLRVFWSFSDSDLMAC
jgi:hypothetical protein